jgi:hypothetical protein
MTKMQIGKSLQSIVGILFLFDARAAVTNETFCIALDTHDSTLSKV